jgi:hypothetical protein
MNWLKKNLLLALGGLAALGMLGFAVYFLLIKKQAVDDVTAQLNTQTQELKSLVTRDPHPNQENVEIAKKEQKKVADFLQVCRKFFVPVANFTNTDSAAFKDLLQTTISDMERDAEKAGVSLPAKYDFTFSAQRKSVDFPADTLVPLATQVAEIRALCDVLFNAHVHALTSVRRVPVAKDDTSASDYLLGRKPATNGVTGAVLTPYEIQFQGFTAELAAVLEGFYRSSNCFIVRNIDVQTNVVSMASDASQSVPTFYYPTAAPPGVAPERQLSPADLMRQRYGLGPNSRYGGRPPMVAPAPAPTTPGVFAPPVRRGPETILDERPFKVTMYIETVRLMERARPRAGK